MHPNWKSFPKSKVANRRSYELAGGTCCRPGSCWSRDGGRRALRHQGSSVGYLCASTAKLSGGYWTLPNGRLEISGSNKIVTCSFDLLLYQSEEHKEIRKRIQRLLKFRRQEVLIDCNHGDAERWNHWALRGSMDRAWWWVKRRGNQGLQAILSRTANFLSKCLFLGCDWISHFCLMFGIISLLCSSVWSRSKWQAYRYFLLRACRF